MESKTQFNHRNWTITVSP